MSAKEFGARLQSKKKCHRFFTIDAGAYLPSHSVITIYFMHDLISGKKRVIIYFHIIYLCKVLQRTGGKALHSTIL